MPGRKFISRFSPSRTNPTDLEAIHVQRNALLDEAVDRVREGTLTANQHYQLFIGPRGSGKTHLLSLISHRLSQDNALTAKLRIAWLSEDETSVSLLDLLLRVYRALEEKYPGEFPAEEQEKLLDLKPAEVKRELEKLLLAKLGERTLLVMMENLDLLFDALSEGEQRSLRGFLQNNRQVTIVGTAQRLFEGIESRSAPFFGFFQTEYLKFLTVEEATELLSNIARIKGDTELAAFLATPKGRSRVRALHHLSGGNHRVFIILSEFITKDSLNDLVQPFEELVDDLTPYYQERIRFLSPLQRKIVEFLCGVERTVPVKEIARNLFTTPQSISSQLKALREMGYVDSRQYGRESLYELAEPLMRLCVEVKGNKSNKPLQLVVDFLRVWYDAERLNEYLAALPEKAIERIYVSAALEKLHTDPIHRRIQYLFEDIQPLDLQSQEGIVAEFLAECQELFHKESYHEIVTLTEAFLKSRNLSAKVRCRLILRKALALSLIGRLQEALDDCSRAIELEGLAEPGLAIALLARARIFLELRRTDEAIATYNHLIDLKNAPAAAAVEALMIRAEIFDQSGKTDEAIADYTRVIDFKDASIDQIAKALINRGVTFGELGRTNDAITDCNRVINLKGAPLDLVVKALINRGVNLGRLGRIDDEIADYTRILELKKPPVDAFAEAAFYRGVTFGQLGRYEEAIADYSRIIELKSASAEQIVKALTNRGAAFAQLARSDEAISDCTRIIELESASAEQIVKAMLNRGVVSAQMGQTDDEIADYTRVIEMKDSPVDQVTKALFNRGVALAQLRRTDEAIADFARVTELSAAAPTQEAPAAYIAWGEMLFLQGKWNEGLEKVARALSTKNEHFDDFVYFTTDIINATSTLPGGEKVWQQAVPALAELHAEHTSLSLLGTALTASLGHLKTTFLNVEALRLWRETWENAGRRHAELKVALRIFSAGVEYLIKRDEGVLSQLLQEERRVVREALGLGEELTK